MAIDARRLAVEGAYIVKFPRHKDDRGFLQELFNADKYPDEITQHFPIKQITFSTSRQVCSSMRYSYVKFRFFNFSIKGHIYIPYP